MKTVEEETLEESDGSLHAMRTTIGRVHPYKVQVLVDECEVPLEIDTGASRSIISESMFRSICPKRKHVASNVKSSTYTKEPLAINITIEYSGQTHKLVLY